MSAEASLFRSPSSRSKAQSGQVLIWLLATIATVGAIAFAVYNTGQLHIAKAKTVNTADSAALAGAKVQARILNMIAYNNRSMIANEVFLVQLLSVESWLSYFGSTAKNAGKVVDVVALFFPIMKPIGTLLEEVGDTAETARDEGISPAIDLLIPSLEYAKDAFSYSHNIVYFAGALMADRAAETIVRSSRSSSRNRFDPSSELDRRTAVQILTFAANETRWLTFVKQYSGDSRANAKQVLLASRDDFSTNRPGQPWFNASALVAGTTKLGGTKLHGFERWESQETFEFWGLGIKGKEYTPIGWGRSNVAEKTSQGNQWDPNRWAQELAWDDGKNYSHESWTGVPSLFDLSDTEADNRAKWGVDYIAVVGRSKENTMTTSNLSFGISTDSPLGSSEVDERLHEGRQSAMAKARTFFERPQRTSGDRTIARLARSDEAKEYGSLYSPFWQSRLVDFTKAEKSALMESMGIYFRNAVLTPGAE